MNQSVRRLRQTCLTLGLAASAACVSGQTNEPIHREAPSPTRATNNHGDRGPLIVVPPISPRMLVPAPPHSTRGFSPEVQFEPAASATVAPPPLSGGTLLIMRDGRTAVASDPDRDRLWVVDVLGEQVTAEVALSPGDEPGRLTEDGAGRVHVALRRGGALVSFTPGVAGGGLERRPVCPSPRGVAFQSSTQQVHVACAGGELVSLPAGGGPSTRTLQLEDDLRDVVVARQGGSERLVVTRFRRAEALVLSLEGRIEERLRPADALNLSRRSSVSRPAHTRFVPTVAWRAVAGPDGTLLMAHQRSFNGEVGASDHSGYGGVGGCDSIVQSVVSSLRLGAASPPLEPAPAMAATVLPVDLALSPDGQRVAVLSAGTSRLAGRTSKVMVSAPATLAEASASSPDCVHASVSSWPQMESVQADTWSDVPGEAVVASNVAGQGMALAFDGRGEVVVQTRAPATLRIPRTGKVIALGAAQPRDTGYTVFHAATFGNMACAACHPEAMEDGHTWNFVGLGPRRTQFLRVGLAQTAPFHWDGSLATLPALMDDVFTGRMMGAKLDEFQVAALGSWLDRLPRPPARRAPADAAVTRGKALFESASVGCATCHKGPQLTDNLTHDVGTGAMLQTPSLVGVSWHPPLMHDGCASTLLGRFAPSCGGDDRHGVISRLGVAEIGDLIAYLESL